jgi:hypothetical protein
MISFQVSEYDADVLRRIALRATFLAGMHNITYDIQTASMDFTAVHANGTPLRLDDLLNFDDFDFLHDMVGIRRHLNRETGQLDGCFVPRSAKREDS